MSFPSRNMALRQSRSDLIQTILSNVDWYLAVVDGGTSGRLGEHIVQSAALGRLFGGITGKLAELMTRYFKVRIFTRAPSDPLPFVSASYATPHRW